MSGNIPVNDHFKKIAEKVIMKRELEENKSFVVKTIIDRRHIDSALTHKTIKKR